MSSEPFLNDWSSFKSKNIDCHSLWELTAACQLTFDLIGEGIMTLPGTGLLKISVMFVCVPTGIFTEQIPTACCIVGKPVSCSKYMSQNWPDKVHWNIAKLKTTVPRKTGQAGSLGKKDCSACVNATYLKCGTKHSLINVMYVPTRYYCNKWTSLYVTTESLYNTIRTLHFAQNFKNVLDKFSSMKF